ncbi:hypothetical protein [Flavobacterium sp.]|jgi:hypothetical protein|uniref:hypothetical protein n=1 Tax=Flavobacterium sp. TaxID=239 RepID=UPI0037C00FFE
MRKIKPKLILIQWLGIFFLISGFLRLFYSFYGTEIEYLKTGKEDFHSHKTLLILSDFLWYRVYWAFGAYIFGMIIIALINWNKKNHFLNTILLLILGFAIFPMGLLFRGVISNYFNQFGGLFSKDYTYAFLIGGLTLIIIGSLFIWKSISTETNTTHNSSL